MEDFFVYIDDSGSPGQKSANKLIAPETKIWVAVILNSREKDLVDSIIEQTLTKIKPKLPLPEFHFTDIYSGVNNFKGVDTEERLCLFELFTELYNIIQPRVLVHAVGEKTLINSGFSEAYLAREDNGFHFNNQSDYALYLTLLDVESYLGENTKDNKHIQVIIDKGRRKADKTQKLSGIFNLISEVTYKSSSEIYGLQFVDFIAFTINRIQNNFAKKRSDFDNKFMSIVGKLKLNSNLNMVAVSDIECLNMDVIESSLTKETVNIESVKYIEALSSLPSLESPRLNREELLQKLLKIKQEFPTSMSKELQDILDIAKILFLDT